MKFSIPGAWSTNNNVTIYLIEQIPDEIWVEKIPGYKQKTIRMVGAHLHNCRGMWVKAVGPRFGIAPAAPVDRHRVSRADLVEALRESGDTVYRVLEASLASGGAMSGFTPSDVHHFAAYLIAHEGHHRGQITMAARQLGYPLSQNSMAGMWQWGPSQRGSQK